MEESLTRFWYPVRFRASSTRCEYAPGASGGGRSRLWRSPKRSEEHTSELQSLTNLVCRLLLEKKKKIKTQKSYIENKMKLPTSQTTYSTLFLSYSIMYST